MDDTLANKLLNDRRVVAEIQRHLWIESEKAGYDIGFEKAKEDWLKNFSKAWMEYHMPEELINARKAAMRKEAPLPIKARLLASLKRRRAKSYLK